MKNKKIISTIGGNDYKNAVSGFLSNYSITANIAELSVLHEIVKKFSKFPYENLSKIIKNRKTEGLNKLRLPEEVFEENREYNFGGTCFSLTFYLKKILVSAGFSTYPVLADMKWGKNVHCSLVVLLDGVKYLVDPGYLITTPMEINKLKPKMYKTEFSGVELIFRRDSRRVELYTFNSADRKWRYSFEDKPVTEDEFAKAWLESFSLKTMKGLCLNKVENNTRIYIHNTFMREENFNTKKNYKIKNNLHQTIYDRFGIKTDLVEEAMEYVKELSLSKE
ncbi:arylamine N-acetyltransferase [bacterium]|nr:arylamine N-acetyltransferase [bacterium]